MVLKPYCLLLIAFNVIILVIFKDLKQLFWPRKSAVIKRIPIYGDTFSLTGTAGLRLLLSQYTAAVMLWYLMFRSPLRNIRLRFQDVGFFVENCPT